MSQPIDPVLEQIRSQLVESSSQDIERVIAEARREALNEFKALLKERMLRAIFEHAQDTATEAFLDPSTGSSSGTPSGDGSVNEPKPHSSMPVFMQAPPSVPKPEPPVIEDEHADPPAPVDDEEPAPIAQPIWTDPAEHAAEPADATAEASPLFKPVEPKELLLDGEEEMDSEILQEIEAIREQITKNEQLVSQLKPFFSSGEGGHA